MRSMIRIELWKAFHNKMFLSALLFGIAISAINVVENIAIVRELSPYLIGGDGTGGYQGFSLFVNWIAVNGTSLGNRILLFVWPILAAMPYGWSYYQERRKGAYNQVAPRCGVKVYFLSKYIAVFVSGGVVIAVPFLFNLLVNALILPYCVPKVISSLVMIFDGHFLSEVFYTSPWLHALIWCCVVFLFGGAVACLSFLAGTKPGLQVMVILSPFAVLVLIDSVLTLLRELNPLSLELSPIRMILAATPNPNPEWLIGSVFAVLLFSSMLIGYWQVKNHEFA